jgi:predicted metal-dependent hydrolase
MSAGIQLCLFGSSGVKPFNKVIGQEKEINLEEIGNIRLIKKAGIKRISISIKPFTGVRVTLPFNMEFSKAEKFVHSKTGWIIKNLGKIEKAERGITVFDHSINFATRYHHLEIHPFNGNNITARISTGKIEILYPFELDVTDNNVQKVIRTAIERTWRIEAMEYLPVRVKDLATKFGFSYKSVSIKNARTRWGSCSSGDNLNFSLHLMRLPDYLCDYIILHELTHTIHKNHSPEFWHHLEKVSGEAKKHDTEMKNYRIDIY